MRFIVDRFGIARSRTFGLKKNESISHGGHAAAELSHEKPPISQHIDR